MLNVLQRNIFISNINPSLNFFLIDSCVIDRSPADSFRGSIPLVRYENSHQTVLPAVFAFFFLLAK